LAPTPLQLREERLAHLNRLLLPLLRAARRYAAAWRVLLPSIAGTTRVESTRDYTASIIQLNLPASNPLLVAVYVSMQRSSPITPSQLKPKLHKLKTLVNRLRGRTFTAADIVYIIVAPKGYTTGARKLAANTGVNAVKNVEEAAAKLRTYIRARLQKLAQAVKGKRIWGELPLLIYSLQTILAELGETITIIRSPDLAIELALHGGKIT
jgi:hypothetical protein